VSTEEIRPGLLRWTARHPDWTPEEGGAEGWEPEVASYAYAASDALVVFDPIAPPWDAIDPLVERLGPPHVLLTVFWHARDAPSVLERYNGARLWADTAQTEEVAKRVPISDTFDPGDALPGGVEAQRPREAVFWIPEHRALLAGDVLLGANGGVRVMPDSWLGPRPRDVFRADMERLTDLPIELLLLTHGRVVENGREALRTALAKS
jgi:glyoxylase-like metal-dependent hydrolase (beta-lactamase superfamily II)